MSAGADRRRLRTAAASERAVGAERRVDDRRRRTAELADERPGLGVPEVDGAARARRRSSSLPSGVNARPIRPSRPRGPIDPPQLLAGPRVPDPDAAVVGGGDPVVRPGWNATVPTQPEPLRKLTWGSGAAAGQSLIVPSRLPEAACAPSGLKATQWTNPMWPWKAASSRPVATSQSRRLLSSLHETSCLLSGRNESPRTKPRCPSMVRASLPVARSQSRIAGPSRPWRSTCRRG